MEIWKEIDGTDLKYEVSNYGRVRGYFKYGQETKSPVIKSSSNVKGYLQTAIKSDGRNKTSYVHRLVAQAFIPNPENKPQVNHIDGNRTNNHVDNLEWCTNGENQIHRYQVLGKVPWNKGKKFKKNKNSASTRKVTLNGIEYNSISECMNKTGRSTTYIYKHGKFN